MKNLAADPSARRKLTALRERLRATMKNVKDTGVVPEPLFEDLAGKGTIADYVQSDKFDHGKIVDLAFVATEIDAKKFRVSKRPRGGRSDGALLGLRRSASAWQQGGGHSEELMPLLKDKHAGVRTTAAQALYALAKKDVAADALVADVTTDMDASSLLNLLNTLRRYDLLDRLPKGWEKGK